MPKQSKQVEGIERGDKVRVITDLLCSTTYIKDDGTKRKYIAENGRVYSIKGRKDSKWLLKGNSRRLLMSNVKSTTQEGARKTVIATGNKSAHSFLDGEIQSYSISDDENKAILAKLLNKGAKYLSYDPYKVKGFVLIDTPHLPKDCSELVPFQGASLVYCFEDSVLCLL